MRTEVVRINPSTNQAIRSTIRTGDSCMQVGVCERARPLCNITRVGGGGGGGFNHDYQTNQCSNTHAAPATLEAPSSLLTLMDPVFIWRLGSLISCGRWLCSPPLPTTRRFLVVTHSAAFSCWLCWLLVWLWLWVSFACTMSTLSMPHGHQPMGHKQGGKCANCCVMCWTTVH